MNTASSGGGPPGPGAAPPPRRVDGLRVLYSFPHTLGAPGIGTTALNQVRGLVEWGAEVHLVCTHLGADVPGVAEVTETLTVRRRRIPHRALGRVERAYGAHDARVARSLRPGRRAPDVVHAWPAGCIRTLEAAARAGVPAAREAPNAHTAETFEASERAAREAGVPLPPGHSHLSTPERLAREEREFAAAAVLLVPSEYVEQSFLRRGTPAHRLRRHRYGFDPDRFRPADPPPGADAPLQAVFVGRGDPTKGLHLALRAWRDSGAGERGVLTICGAVEPAYRAAMGDLLRQPGVRELGFVDDVPARMREAHVLLLPSATEGSALVTYEARGSGVVPLVSDATGAQVTDGVDALVHPAGDVATLTGHLRAVAGDPGLRSRLREATLARRDALTWSAAGAVLAGIHMDLAGGDG